MNAGGRRIRFRARAGRRMSRRRGERGRRLRPPPSPGPTRSQMVKSWRFRQICCRKLDAPGVASAASGMDARGRVYGGMRLTILTFDTAARRSRSPRVSICPPSLADFLSPFGSPRSQIEQRLADDDCRGAVARGGRQGGDDCRTFVATRNVVAGHCDAARGGSLRRARGNHTRIEPPPPPRILLRGAPSPRRAPARRRRARRELGEGRSRRQRDGRVSKPAQPPG